MSNFQFIMRAGPQPGKVFPIEGIELTIGRDPTNAITINDAEVSRKHARMELRGSIYFIQDLGSTNGTFINGNRTVGIQGLNPNDTVSFGENIVLIYQATADPNATMLSAQGAPRTIYSAPKPTAPPVSAPRPAPQASPVQPQAPAPQPAPAYSGQVPAYPAPAAATPAKKKGGIKIVIILVVLLVICLIVACVGFLVWVDADQTGARWCQYLPFVAQLFNAVCP
jgi:hypothetical protein